jgi:hypothetical protein
VNLQILLHKKYTTTLTGKQIILRHFDIFGVFHRLQRKFCTIRAKGSICRRIQNIRRKSRIKIFACDEEILVARKNFGCESAVRI